jgi:diguanylate cyclase (GGDEF)-like protein
MSCRTQQDAESPIQGAEVATDTERLLEQANKLATLNAWFEVALNNMARGLSMFDADKRLIVCNALYREIYDLPESLTTPGTPLATIIAFHAARAGSANTAEELQRQQSWIEQHSEELRHGKTFTHTQHLQNGRIVQVTNQPLADGGWVDIQEDITERALAEERIAWLARHCPLTEIANRFYLRERLELEIERLRPNERLAVHLIDLDHFKQVNDTLGHATGDAVLRAVAKRMCSTVRETDFVGRLGGDEFAIIQRQVVDEDQAASLASRLVTILNAPYRVLGSSTGIGASIGIAICPDHGTNADTLLQRADTALYRVKSCGRGNSSIYQALDEQVARERIELQADLREALKRNQLVLHYQPVVDVTAAKVTGCEALMRWNHPKLGLLPPSVFIPIAEKAGLIGEIGEWALRQACKDAAGWQSHITVAVNLSSFQFVKGDLATIVKKALKASRLEAKRLEIEVAESALLKREAHTLDVLRDLKTLGVRLVLDDFGTGFASLGYMQNFSFDKIKIDRSLITDLAGRRDKMAVVGAVTGLAQTLGIGPVAEGVEVMEELEGAAFAGCTQMQGFYFSPAVPCDDVDRAISDCLVKLAEYPK